MYPFESRRRWLMAGRSAHLIEASRPLWAGGSDAMSQILARRARHLAIWLRVRLGLILLLSPGLVATLMGAIARRLEILEPIAEALDVLFVIAGSISLLLSLLFLVVTRTIGQLEADLIAAMIQVTGPTLIQHNSK